MSPKRREDHARPLGERDRVVDPAHRDHADRAARPVHELDLVRQEVLDPVPVDRVGVPAAHLHDLAVSGPARRARRARASFWRARPTGTRRRTSRRRQLPSAMPAWQRRSSPTATGSTSSIATRLTQSADEHRRSCAVDLDDDGAHRSVAAGDAVVVSRASSIDRALADLLELPLGASPICSRSSSVSRASPRRSVEREAHVDEHPVTDLGLRASAIETTRRTPEISTFARPASCRPLRRSVRGMPRHMVRSSSSRRRPGRSLCPRRSTGPVRDRLGQDPGRPGCRLRPQSPRS